MPNDQDLLSLGDLPDDILFLILRELDTARDIYHASLTCRRLYYFIQTRGWRSFALKSFPSLRPTAQPSSHTGDGTKHAHDEGDNGRDTTWSDWSRVAQSLTWQSRAWDKRAISFQGLLPRGSLQTRQRRQASFRPSLAVHFQPDGDSCFDGEEMVVWGAGEDVVARYRHRGRHTHTTSSDGNRKHHPAPVATWQVFDGKKSGFRPGYDDVNSIAVVPNALGRPRHRGILAGRDSGSLSLFSGETDGSFGQPLSHFSPEADSDVDHSRLYSLDVSTSGRDRLVAVTTPSHLLFYPLSGHADTNGDDSNGNVKPAEPVDIHPTSVFGITGVGLDSGGRRHPYNARWMAADGVLAVGMITESNPISYLTATPAGFTMTAAAKNDDLAQRFGMLPSSSLLPSSMEPVGLSAVTGGNGNLLLSSWSQGGIRLQDLRTPSPWDLVYEDDIQLTNGSQALLSMGSERFLAGSQDDTALVIFDFRWSRRYHHTAALPCSSRLPFPNPPEIDRLFSDSYAQSLQSRPRLPPLPPAIRRCDFGLGRQQQQQCRWHAASEYLLYRPNCSLYLRRSLASYIPNPVVWSLARASSASDLAPANFYVGLNGCIVEGSLFAESGGDDHHHHQHHHHVGQTVPDPNFGYPDVLDQLPPSLVPPPPPGQMSASTWRKHQRETTQNHHYYRTIDLHVSMFETGDGICAPEHRRDVLPLPRLRSCRRTRSEHVDHGMYAHGGGGNQHGNTADLGLERLRLDDATSSEDSEAMMVSDDDNIDDDPERVLRIQHRLDASYHVNEDFSVPNVFKRNQEDVERIWERDLASNGVSE